MRIICVDPGLRGCGVASFLTKAYEKDEEGLECAFYVKNSVDGRGYAAHTALGAAVVKDIFKTVGPYGAVIIEHPVIYPKATNKDLNDLIDVVAVGAAVASWVPGIIVPETVFPSQWKGTVQKQVMLRRIKAALSPREMAVVQETNKSDTEDILDAIGIGLWKLGRLNKKVYPGAT